MYGTLHNESDVKVWRQKNQKTEVDLKLMK